MLLGLPSLPPPAFRTARAAFVRSEISRRSFRVAALNALPVPQLKQQWRDLFESEPPPYNRRFLEHRLACRIQELAYGELKPEIVKRLRVLAEELDGGDPANRRRYHQDQPMPGTRLIREWQGIEHCVTVRDEGFEYQGRPYKSLSAIARAR
jgi:hypothetical protein